MASEQAKQMAQRYASVRERTSKPDLGLATRRDIDESLHSVAREPERVSFAEVDADGVPALWCIPEGSDAEHVLLHSHAGGTVVFSMHSDRKAAGPSGACIRERRRPRPTLRAWACAYLSGEGQSLPGEEPGSLMPGTVSRSARI